LNGCNDDDPKKEQAPELITKVTLTFTPDEGEPIVATWNDPDGDGIQPPVIEAIDLATDTEYELTIQLTNALDPLDPEDITAEVSEERNEHMFFFAWTNNVFSSPSGSGNIDNREDGVNYNDEDDNGFPLGLNTSWTSAAATTNGTFTVILKHQPDLKSETSTSATGDTDLDITFIINVD
jgi:hypothetical protein